MIDATLDHGHYTALNESTNSKIRVLTRMAYGLKTPEALIALELLSFGGYRPDLRSRTPPNDPRERQERHNSPKFEGKATALW